jgi:hypothetical protein
MTSVRLFAVVLAAFMLEAGDPRGVEVGVVARAGRV